MFFAVSYESVLISIHAPQWGATDWPPTPHKATIIIFTTNIEFSKWGTVFADDKLAAAIIDRIVHHGRLLEFTGQSRRVSEALMFGRNTSAQPEK